MRHALVIEDEFLIALHLQTVLEDAGYASVQLVATEQEAITAADAMQPALIVSDVRLAEGTGPAAVRAIRHAYGPIPTIYITGNPESCATCDADAPVFLKPVNDARLVSMVRALEACSMAPDEAETADNVSGRCLARAAADGAVPSVTGTPAEFDKGGVDARRARLSSVRQRVARAHGLPWRATLRRVAELLWIGSDPSVDGREPSPPQHSLVK